MAGLVNRSTGVRIARRASVWAGLAGVLAASAPALAQTATVATTAAPVPFAVGEELTYRASFGRIRVGTAHMNVQGIEVVRGRPAYHVLFSIDGGIPGFRVRDRYESWIDVQTLSSLRFTQQIAEGGYHRNTSYDIYPERAKYQKDGDTLQSSVRNPLDDGSFIYAVRAAGVGVGDTRSYDRYFRPDRNPVVLTGLRAETVKVGAGTFSTVVVKPTIRSNGIFSENGEAQIWFTDDAHRYPVQLKTHFSKFTLTLSLESVKQGTPATPITVANAQ